MIDKEKYDQLIKQLRKCIMFNVHKRSVINHPFLNSQDLQGECYYVVAKVIKKYPDMDIDELAMICRAAINNHVTTLRKKYLVTGRRVELDSLPYFESEEFSNAEKDRLRMPDVIDYADSLLALGTCHMATDTAATFESLDRITMIIDSLDEDTLRVFRAAMGDDQKTGNLFKLHASRRNFVYKDPAIRLTLDVLAESLCMSVRKISRCIRDIRQIVALLTED